jgi:hypothetical protein
VDGGTRKRGREKENMNNGKKTSDNVIIHSFIIKEQVRYKGTIVIDEQ